MMKLLLLSLLVARQAPAAERAAGIRPEPRGAECHQMLGPCPPGWHERGPKRRGADDGWAECCQDEGEFKPLPPQPHEKFPVCNPKTRDEWLALGIEFEEGCDLRYATCAIKYRPDDAQPDVPPPAAGQPAPARAPARTEKAAPLPRAELVRRDGDRGASGSVSALVAALKGAAPRERERAVLELAALGTRASAALGALAPLLTTDPSPRVRACAVVAVASVARTNDAAISLLRKVLSDRDPKVRAVAAQALKALAGEDRPAERGG